MDFLRSYALKTKIAYGILVFLCLISIIIISVTACYSNHGFDLSDEGFYINSIVYPHLYTKNFTLFGFVYHPLFQLVNQNWIILRQLNLGIILGLSYLLSFKCLKLFDIKHQLNPKFLHVLSLPISLIASTYLSTFNWLISPSYNSLNFIGLLILGIGIVSKSQMFIIALGLFCIFMSKISSFVVMTLIFGIYCLFSKAFSMRQLFQLACYLLVMWCVAIFLIDGNILIFANRLLEGVKAYRILVTPSVWRLDLFHPESKDKNTLIVMTVFFSTCFIYLGIHNKEKRHLLLWLSPLFLLLIKTIDLKHAFRVQEIDLFYVPIIALLNVILASMINQSFQIQKKNIYLGLLFFTIPYAYSFGTSNPYWYQAQMVAYFWFLSALCFLSPWLSNKKTILLVLSPVLFFGLLLVIFCDYRALSAPYRQANIIKHQKTRLKMSQHTQVWVSEELKNCVNGLQAQINQYASKKAFNLVDFTGFSPGLIYLLDANPVGAPWLAANYPNSVIYLYKTLKPIDLKTSYLLFAEDIIKIKKMPIIKMLGIDVSHEYTKIAYQKCDLVDYGLGEVGYYLYRPN